MSKREQFETVEDYIKAQPEPTQKVLLELKACILDTVPNAIEMFNYGIPAYALVTGGKRDQQIMMAGYKNHVGFYPHPEVVEKFNPELAGLKIGKGSVQFPLNKPLPKKLISKMIQYRLELLKQEI